MGICHFMDPLLRENVRQSRLLCCKNGKFVAALDRMLPATVARAEPQFGKQHLLVFMKI